MSETAEPEAAEVRLNNQIIIHNVLDMFVLTICVSHDPCACM
jgi:hypothetical protein